MTNEFMREERYIVFKVSDLGNSLKGDEIRKLAQEYAEQRRLKGKKPLECVVVEKDWPEYELTWRAIEARVTGAQPALEESAVQTAARIMNVDLIRQRDELRAKVAEMEKQFPICRIKDIRRAHYMTKVVGLDPEAWLYLAPGAQPAPSVPREAIDKMLTQLMDIAVSNGANSISMLDEYVEVAAWLCGIPAQPAPVVKDERAAFREWFEGEQGVAYDGLWSFAKAAWLARAALGASSVPDGWLRAIDEALVVTHLGVANGSDTYEQAREKLTNLIGWHVDVATDPAVNGGWQLVPVNPTETFYQCFSAYDGTSYSNPFSLDDFVKDWREALAKATEAKP